MSDFQTEWVDWGQNIDLLPRRVIHASKLQDIVDAINKANREDRRLRVCGSRFSYSDVAVAHDYILDLGGFNAILALFTNGTAVGHPIFAFGAGIVGGAAQSPVLGAALQPAVAASNRLFAHVQAGITLRDLYLALDNVGGDVPPNMRSRWALPTLGGSAGQTVSGAVSTATHGGDFSLPPLHDMVRAIELIGADGTRHWVERSGPASITDSNLMTQAFQNDPNPPHLHYDDDAFRAVVVSMGCLGIIATMIIELRPQFGLSQQVSGTCSWNTVKGLLRSGALFSLPPWPGVGITAHPAVGSNGMATNPVAWGLEIYVNPYRVSNDYYGDPNPDRHCIIVSRAQSANFGAPFSGAGTSLVAQLGQLVTINAFKAVTARGAVPLIDSVMAAVRSNTPGFAPAFSVADGGSGQSPVLSLEIAVPTTNNGDIHFVDAMLQSFDRIVSGNLDAKLAGAFSLRYTQPTEAFLAMQNFSPATPARVCHVEVPTMKHVDVLGNPIHQDTDPSLGLENENELESSSAEHLLAFERLADQFGAHLHWGQLSLTNGHNPSRYEKFPIWQGIRHRFATTAGPREARALENDFTVRYAISPTVPDWFVVGAGLLPGSPTVAPAAPTGSALNARGFPPTAFRDTIGAVEILVINPDGNVCWTRDPELNRWAWVQQPDPSSLTVLPFNFTGRVAVGLNRGYDGPLPVGFNTSDGHPEAFARNLVDNLIYHAWRDHVGDNHWKSWTALTGGATITFSSSPDVTMGAGNNLVVIARGADNQIYFNTQKATPLGAGTSFGWAGWARLPMSPSGATFAGDPAIGCNIDGTLEIFVRDTTGKVWRSLCLPASGANNNWQTWIALGVRAVMGDPAVARDAVGMLELFAIGGTGELFNLVQTGPDSWAGAGDWVTIPTPSPSMESTDRPSVVLLLEQLQVAARLTDGDLVHFFQAMTSWHNRVLPCRSSDHTIVATSAPCLVVNDQLLLAVLVKTQNDLVQMRSQSSPDGW